MLRALIKEIIFWRWVIPAMWNNNMGRWHVFRNAPTWVIEDFALLAGPIHPSDDPDFRRLFRAAQSELALRLLRKATS